MEVLCDTGIMMGYVQCCNQFVLAVSVVFMMYCVNVIVIYDSIFRGDIVNILC